MRTSIALLSITTLGLLLACPGGGGNATDGSTSIGTDPSGDPTSATGSTGATTSTLPTSTSEPTTGPDPTVTTGPDPGTTGTTDTTDTDPTGEPGPLVEPGDPGPGDASPTSGTPRIRGSTRRTSATSSSP